MAGAREEIGVKLHEIEDRIEDLKYRKEEVEAYIDDLEYEKRDIEYELDELYELRQGQGSIKK